MDFSDEELSQDLAVIAQQQAATAERIQRRLHSRVDEHKQQTTELIQMERLRLKAARLCRKAGVPIKPSKLENRTRNQLINLIGEAVNLLKERASA